MKPIRQLPLFPLALLLSLLLAVPALADAQGKKVLLIVAKADFEDVEYTTPRKIFDAAGLACTVASTKTGTLKGRKGARVQSDLELKDVAVADYDAVVVIGGAGIKKLWKDEDANRIVREAADQGKIVAAICAGPGVLANADVLSGKKGTAHPNSGAKPVMEKHGCTFSMGPVVVDGNVITANGPDAAKAFAEAVVAALN
ncbi:MAG: DJ-1/PfpI family protein [Pseudodesulfovibrio sp.]